MYAMPYRQNWLNGLQGCCLFFIWLTLQAGLLIQTTTPDRSTGNTLIVVVSVSNGVLFASPLIMGLMIGLRILPRVARERVLSALGLMSDEDIKRERTASDGADADDSSTSRSAASSLGGRQSLGGDFFGDINNDRDEDEDEFVDGRPRDSRTSHDASASSADDLPPTIDLEMTVIGTSTLLEQRTLAMSALADNSLFQVSAGLDSLQWATLEGLPASSIEMAVPPTIAATTHSTSLSASPPVVGSSEQLTPSPYTDRLGLSGSSSAAATDASASFEHSVRLERLDTPLHSVDVGDQVHVNDAGGVTTWVSSLDNIPPMVIVSEVSSHASLPAPNRPSSPVSPSSVPPLHSPPPVSALRRSGTMSRGIPTKQKSSDAP